MKMKPVGKKKELNKMWAVPIQPHQQWRLQGSSTDCNDHYKLELPRVWELAGSGRSHKHGEK